MTSAPLLGSRGGSAGEQVGARLAAAREGLAAVPEDLVEVSSDDLAELASLAAGVLAAAEAARAAVVLEAQSRGVIAASDHPRVNRWVEQSCREADVPLTRGQARQLSDIAAACDGHDVSALAEAVTAARVPLESAAAVGQVFRRLKTSIEYPNWEALLEALTGWAAQGASNRDLAALEDALIGQYGPEGALDDEHERLATRRELTHFRRDRAGMLTATVRLDPAAEAAFSTAITALSAPQPDEADRLDERTPGQRRADALLTLAALATTPSAAIPGSGSKARVVVTIPLHTLTAGLTEHPQHCTEHGEHTQRGEPQHGEHAGSAERGERGYGRTAGDQAISPTETRILACDAHIIPAVLGTKSELLDLGHAKRLITPGLAQALHLRDKGCTYPGCTAPPSWCDGHHIIHWARGGPTDLANLALLCRHHHIQVHRHDHTATIDTDGVHWTRHDTTPIGNTPRWDTAA